MLSFFLFMLYTSDFQYNCGSYHLQKYSDDFAVAGQLSDGQEDYRALGDDFVEWSEMR